VNAKIAGVLVVLLVAVGGGALLVKQKSGGDKPAEASVLGQPLLKDLKAADVATVVIREPKTTLTVAKKGEQWTLAERNAFPADYDKVRDFVLKAIGLKIGQAEPIGEQDRARLNLDASGTAVEFLGADGKPLARLVVGRKYFKGAPPENAEKAIGDGRYVMLAGDDKRVYVIGDPLTQATTKSAEWISKAQIGADKVKSVEVKYLDAAASWKVERSGDNADWKLAGLRGGEKLDITRANAASYTFGQIEPADVAPAATTPAEAGLDKPTVITVATLDGRGYVLKIGKTENGNAYASLASTGEVSPAAKALEGRIVLVPRGKLDDILKRRADLLEAKPEKKK
jgi:hypothetical protein